jgi:hypothetical protein
MCEEFLGRYLHQKWRIVWEGMFKNIFWKVFALIADECNWLRIGFDCGFYSWQGQTSDPATKPYQFVTQTKFQIPSLMVYIVEYTASSYSAS